MDTVLLLTAMSAAASVALLVIGVYRRATLTRRLVSGRISQCVGEFSFQPVSVLRERRGRLPALSLLPLSPEATRRLQLELERAGWYITVGEFRFIRLMSALAFAVGGWLLTLRLDLTGSLQLIAVLVAMLLGWRFPGMVLRMARERRLQRIEEQLPDALTAMAKSLRAGSGILQALSYAANETPEPLGTELQRTLRDLQLGVEAEAAFSDLSRRVGSPDLDIAVTAIVIQRTVGGNLSEILNNVTNTIRERARIYGEVRVLTTRQRWTANLCALVPVLIAAAFILINPQFGRLLIDTVPGRIALAIGVFFELVGIWLIRRLAVIEV